MSKLARLEEWLAGHQALVSGKIEVRNTKHSGRGLYATQDIRANEQLVSIPHSLLLNFTTAMAHMNSFQSTKLADSCYSGVQVPSTQPDEITAIYSQLPVDRLLELLSFQLLGMYLVLERRRGDNLFWAPFLGMLPELAELVQAPVVGRVLKPESAEETQKRLPRLARKHAAKVAERFEHDVAVVEGLLSPLISGIPIEEHLWAWMCINSRCLYMSMPQAKDASDNFTLAPFVDFLNHLTADQCGIKTDKAGFHVVTSSSYKPEQELFFSYGPHSNEFLLCEYGFVLPENRWNYIDISDIVMPLLRPAQTQYLQQNNYYGEYTVNSDGMSFRTEIALAALQEPDPQKSDYLQQFVSGNCDGSRYAAKTRLLLQHILSKLLGDSKHENGEKDAIAQLWQDIKETAQAAL